MSDFVPDCLRGGPLRVVSFNIQRGLHHKIHKLCSWMVTHRIDVMCLTETGDPGPVEVKARDLFVSVYRDQPSVGGCAVLVAPWLPHCKLLCTSHGGSFVAVQVAIHRLEFTVMAAYAPCSPDKHPEVAQTFWERLLERVMLFQHPMILGVDVNYHAFLHDTLHPDGWVDVTKKVPAISAFWECSGLVDCQPAANPGEFEPTFFATRGGEPLNDAGNYCIPVQKLLPHCRAATRIDVVAVSSNLLAGVRSLVFPVSPVVSDHRPVLAELANVGVWAQHPNGVKWQRRWVPNFQDANVQHRLDFYEVACCHLNAALVTADRLDLWELNQGIVDALTEAGKKLPQASKGGIGGHDKVFNLTTKLRRKALVILRLAQHPEGKSDRVCSWAHRLAKLSKGVRLLWLHLQSDASDRLLELPFSPQPLIQQLGMMVDACDAHVAQELDAFPSSEEWAALALTATQFREASQAFLQKYLHEAQTPWAEEAASTTDLMFARNPKGFLNRFVKPSTGVGHPQWVKADTGQVTDKPAEVMEGYRRYFQQLYGLPADQVPLHNVKVVQMDKCWEGLMDPISEDELLASVRHMRPKTAPGPDGLVTPMIRWAATPVTYGEKGAIKVAPTISSLSPMMQALNLLWNRCLAEQSIPDAWKLSHLSLIPKDAEGVAGDPARTRPIAVASILYRGLMWIIMKRLLALGDTKIPWNQRGFRHGGQCIDVAEIIDAALYSSQVHKLAFCLTQADLAKAYDNLLHQAILQDLAVRHRMPQEFVYFMKNVLSGLKAQIWTRSGLSPVFNIAKGIRQGCPLSPILFALLVSCRICDAERKVQLESLEFFHSECRIPHHLEYADDLTLITSSTEEASLLGEAIMTELAPLGLTISAPKSAYATLQLDESPPVVWNGTPVQWVDSHPLRILGFWFDMRGWQAHCQHLEDDIRGLLTRLNRLSLAGTSKIRIFNWIARGKVAYSAAIADTLSLAEQLDKAAAAAAKIWLGLHASTSSAALHTPISQGGFGLVSLKDEVLVCRSTYLMRRYNQFHTAIPSTWNPLRQLFSAYYDLLTVVDPVRQWFIHPQLWKPPHVTGKRGFWLARALSAWVALDVHAWPGVTSAADWTKQYTHFELPPGEDSLSLWTDGSAKEGKASWAVVEASTKMVASGCVWDAQTPYRGELCGLFMALHLSLPDKPLVIHTDSQAAKQAVEGYLQGKPSRWDSPSKSLVAAISSLALQRTAHWQIRWVKAHVGIAGNELADAAAKQALMKPAVLAPPLHPKVRPAAHFWVSGSTVSSDYRDSFTAVLWKWGLDATPLVSSCWAMALQDGWVAYKLDASLRRFVFVARGHALPTMRRVAFYTRDMDRPITCGLCQLANDTATHWYECPALDALWQQQLSKAPLAGVLPDSCRSNPQQRERLAWGLLPKSVKGQGSVIANACVGAARAVWHLREELWITAHKQSKCGPPPRQLMLQDHSAKAKARAKARAALGDTTQAKLVRFSLI